MQIGKAVQITHLHQGLKILVLILTKEEHKALTSVAEQVGFQISSHHFSAIWCLDKAQAKASEDSIFQALILVPQVQEDNLAKLLAPNQKI